MRWQFLGLLVAWLVLQAGPVRSADDRPAPHLGYGIHVAPNTKVDRNLIDALGMDWVKIYDPGQANVYPDKHVLYRMDLHWPTDWAAFKVEIANQVRSLAGLHIDAVEIGNEPPTPLMMLRPQPLCVHSNAWRMTLVLPMHSKL